MSMHVINICMADMPAWELRDVDRGQMQMISVLLYGFVCNGKVRDSDMPA